MASVNVADGPDRGVAGVRMLVRATPVAGAPRRLAYRAEPARDWEPRLDGLWQRVRNAYPAAAVRDAEHALRRFAGHSTMRHHRFLILPRFSDRAVAWAVFSDDGGDCCWLDLVWDHEHPGALELLAHISGRLAAQWGSDAESLLLAGDDAAETLLARRGFRPRDRQLTVSGPWPFSAGFGTAGIPEGRYQTAADMWEIDR